MTKHSHWHNVALLLILQAPLSATHEGLAQEPFDFSTWQDVREGDWISYHDDGWKATNKFTIVKVTPTQVEVLQTMVADKSPSDEEDIRTRLYDRTKGLINDPFDLKVHEHTLKNTEEITVGDAKYKCNVYLNKISSLRPFGQGKRRESELLVWEAVDVPAFNGRIRFRGVGFMGVVTNASGWGRAADLAGELARMTSSELQLMKKQCLARQDEIAIAASGWLRKLGVDVETKEVSVTFDRNGKVLSKSDSVPDISDPDDARDDILQHARGGRLNFYCPMQPNKPRSAPQYQFISNPRNTPFLNGRILGVLCLDHGIRDGKLLMGPDGKSESAHR